jgi:hypothetical protein
LKHCAQSFAASNKLLAISHELVACSLTMSKVHIIIVAARFSIPGTNYGAQTQISRCILVLHHLGDEQAEFGVFAHHT